MLSVKASGLVTPVGLNSPSTCAALRAGIRGVDAEFLWDLESGDYVTAGKVPLPQWWEGVGKLPKLVAPAIYECLQKTEACPASEIVLLLGVASFQRPSRWKASDSEIIGAIEHELEQRFHPASRVIAHGHVSGAVALRSAQKLVHAEDVRSCIIAGVDSFLEQETLDAYLAERRILTENNSNGFSPGEAGSAVLVGPAEDNLEGELRIIGLGFAKEEATITSDKPLRGEGLTNACRNALTSAGRTMADIDYRITDLNGEHYKFKEATFAFGRLLKERRPSIDLWHPIEYIGDIGAAIGPCVLAVALHAAQKGYAPGASILFHFSNDGGERAAIVAEYHNAVSS